MRTRIAVLFAAAVVAGCSSTTTNTPAADGGAAKDAAEAGPKSDCGHPGDLGNALGVGKFCQYISDCSSNTKATLCSQLGDPDNYFCTFTCMESGPTDQCGTGASCACQGGQCGCYPDVCGRAPVDAGIPPAEPDSAAADSGVDSGAD